MSIDPDHLPIFETERLRLEPLTPADADHLSPIMADPDVMAFWDVAAFEDPDSIVEVVRSQVEDMATGRAVHWTMRTLEAGEFLGACDLSEIDRRHRRAEVGFLLGRDAWGRGYALEAMRTVIAFAASQGLRKLAARTHLGNRRSDALLMRLGFQEEGLLRGHIEKDGERRDCRLFGLLL